MALGITPIDIINKGTHPLLVKDNDWERVELNNIAEVQNGYAFSSNLFNHKDGLPLIRIRDIFSEKTENYYSGEYNEDFIVNHKDILIGMDGDFRISRWPGQKGLLNQRVCRIKFFSSYYLESFLFLCVQPYLDAIHSETSAVTVKHLSSKTINEIPLPLPPLPIQRAIVSKIEALFSDLDNGIANFKKAQEQLKIYRQAVLKKAFEGELTKEWREKIVKTAGRPYQLPTAEERKSKDARPCVSDNLPNRWKWVKLGEIAEKIQIGPFGSQLHQEDYIENGIPLINPMQIKDGKIIPDYSYSISAEKRNSLPNYILQTGDLVLGRRGEMGRCGLITESENGWFCGTGSLFIRPKSKKLNSLFLHLVLSGAEIKKYLQENAAGTTMANLNSKIVNGIPLRLPPFAEQTQIVQEIESRLSVTDNLEFVIRNSIEKAEALRQSILKKAFEGRLLSEAEVEQCKQAADYEPASELLKKIKAEKLAKEQEKKKATTKKKSKK